MTLNTMFRHSLHIGVIAFLTISSVPNSTGQEPRYLIVHSDDAGMCHSVNTATAAGLESGIVSSASIMVPCPWFKEFARYAETHPQYDYGIHLTLTSEWDTYRWGPVASRDQVPSLVDPEGYLWDSSDLVRENAKADEVRIELKAQIDRALAFGVPLTHLDTHMGAVLTRPDLIDIYVDLGVEYNLPVMFVKAFDPATAAAYPAIAERMEGAIAKLRGQHLPLLDNILQFYGGDIPAQREQLYYDQIAAIGPGVTQLIIHCGYDGDELRAVTTSAARRDQDRAIFTDPKMSEFLHQQGIELLTWKEFRSRFGKLGN